jgi:hypothetical protein
LLAAAADRAAGRDLTLDQLRPLLTKVDDLTSTRPVPQRHDCKAPAGSQAARQPGAAELPRSKQTRKRAGEVPPELPPRPTAAAAAAAARAALPAALSVIGLLAFAEPARCGVPALEALFAPAAWARLRALFEREALALLGHDPDVSHLEAAVALGVVALKTPECARACRLAASAASGASGTANADARTCPLCTHPDFFGATVARAPSCRRTVTRLRCPVTGEASESFRVLPGGRVVSADALRELTSVDGRHVLDAASGEAVAATAVRRAYFA